MLVSHACAYAYVNAYVARFSGFLFCLLFYLVVIGNCFFPTLKITHSVVIYRF